MWSDADKSSGRCDLRHSRIAIASCQMQSTRICNSGPLPGSLHPPKRELLAGAVTTGAVVSVDSERELRSRSVTGAIVIAGAVIRRQL